MAVLYLLDTNILVHLVRRDPDKDFDHLDGQFLTREWVDPLADKRSNS
jgi:hypothetical protein